MFMSILADKNGQNIIYWQQQPNHALNNNDAIPKIIDTLLMCIFKLGQGVCHFL